MLGGFDSRALRNVEVSISGAWREGRHRDWQGEARASEPLVAVTFAETAGVVSWCKSQRPRPDAQSVELRLGNYDSSHRDVQVSFSIGEGQVVSRTKVDSPSYLPPIPAALTARTAELVHIVSVEGSRRVDLYALFLAGSDIKMGRNGLWHLRRNLVDD